MPDLSLNPADLTFNNPSSTSSLQTKGNAANTQATPKAKVASNAAPRIELEHLYTSLKAAIAEYWAEYKEGLSLFLLGQLNQDEFCLRTDHFLAVDPAVEHLHNQLIAAILANTARETPEPGVAPFVSANDKPVVMSKPVSGDAAEQRLKTEVMQLPARDRRRIKEVPEPEMHDPPPAFLTEYHLARQFRSTDAAPSAVAGGKTNWDLEIRKRYTQPLAAETGEFPDAETIQGRMVPICYEESLPQGCANTCAGLVAAATEHLIKEILSTVYNRTRSNMPAGSVNSILTHRFKKQLQIEEDTLSRGEISKVAGTGLLPVEAKEVATRKSLAMHDLKLATDLGDVGLGQFPLTLAKIMNGYEENEFETYAQLRREKERRARGAQEADRQRFERTRALANGGNDVKMNGAVNGVNGINGVNGTHGAVNYDEEDDDDGYGWAGGSASSRSLLANSLDECLAIGQ